MLTTSANLDADSIRWEISEKGADFDVIIQIPWKSLKLKGPSDVTFDIAVNDNDAEKRLSSIPWSGNGENYKNRFNFGTLIQ